MGIEVEDEILGQEPKIELKGERDTAHRMPWVDLSRAGAGRRTCLGFPCQSSGSIQILSHIKEA